MAQVDRIDLKLLSLLQQDGSLPQRELAERAGLSQNACWRRLKRLNGAGLIRGTQAQIDLAALGYDLTVFVMIRTRHHSKDWADAFRAHVEALPEVRDFYRIGGDWDYLARVVTRGVGHYDRFYQRLITDFDLAAVTGFFAMEAIIEGRPIDLQAVE
ncbi:Lrp/AsnC family transcriptional regulator [Mesobaculum littorinae]|uniref:Lrp/AsnC family transcriptional regulator n=1 Tax=Mesobaculum littorinae TaxID=2486419 RepID=A0A438AJK7_9RHOB|nr:Lrp/AsnC family transcriptional regulator [Mesobaculum littorinae]RVV98900.1 Lrp/AsnC family transcriptional regulator [Mesobaculum littorinae]